MLYIFWILGLGLLAQFFGVWEQKQYNPNMNPDTAHNESKIHVELLRNRMGHYVANGLINSKAATFMLDTGATDVVIPSQLASSFGLVSKGEKQSITANGIVTVGHATIDTLSIGGITLYNIAASINPGMDKTQAILLGMSALKRLELSQVGETLTLTQAQ